MLTSSSFTFENETVQYASLNFYHLIDISYISCLSLEYTPREHLSNFLLGSNLEKKEFVSIVHKVGYLNRN